jgi:hypothetical protein
MPLSALIPPLKRRRLAPITPQHPLPLLPLLPSGPDGVHNFTLRGDLYEPPLKSIGHLYGGEGGIRTHGTLLEYTAFPVLHLRPLGHLSRLD